MRVMAKLIAIAVGLLWFLLDPMGTLVLVLLVAAVACLGMLLEALLHRNDRRE